MDDSSQKLLSTQELIKRLNERGIQIGRTGSDSYNTLRYYTKIGLLPHMVRRTVKKGEATVGHYPEWVVERLIEIEKLKKEGLSNEEIKEKFKVQSLGFREEKREIVSELSIFRREPRPAETVSKVHQLVLALLALFVLGGSLLVLLAGLSPQTLKRLSLTINDQLNNYRRNSAENFLRNISPNLAQIIYPKESQEEGQVAASEVRLGSGIGGVYDLGQAIILKGDYFTPLRIENLGGGQDLIVAQEKGQGVFYLQSGGNLYAQGYANLGGLSVRGSGEIVNSLRVGGTTLLEGATVVGNDLTVTGNASFGQNINVGDSATLGTLEVAGSTEITGDLTLSGSETIAGSLTVSGATRLSSLSVSTSLTLPDESITTSMLVGEVVTTAKLADGSVTTVKIADGAITAGKLADGTVVEAELADGSVTSAKIQDGTIIGSDIADSTLTGAKIAAGAITTIKLADDSITYAKILDGSIKNSKLEDGAVTQIKLADGSVATAKIADGAVTEAKVSDAGVSTVKLQDLAVTTGKISDGAVTTIKLAGDSVTSAKILDATIVSGDIADGTIATIDLSDEVVTTAKLASAAVTTVKIADDAVTSAKILDGTITSGDIADGTIVTIDLADGSVATAKVVDGAITEAKIADASISTDKLQDLAVTTGKIANGAITSLKIADSTITGSNLATNITISTTGNITATTLTATTLTDGTLTISGGDISGAGTITATSFSGSGASLTNLNADQLTLGTVPTARMSGSYTGITGVGTLTTGTWQAGEIGDAYISDTITVSNYLPLTGGTLTGELVFYNTASSTSTTEGAVYYDTDDDNLYLYTTAGWVDLTQQDTDTQLTESQTEDFIFDADNTGSLTTTGTLQGNSLTDGTLTISGGDISGAGTITATSFSGSGASLTNLNADQLTLGTVPTARMSGSYTGITGVGTITTGTWQAGVVATAYGGTGLSSFTQGDLLYYSSGGALSQLPIGSADRVLVSTGTAPQWVVQSSLSVGNADTLDLLDATSFLRSDTSDSFTLGTLTMANGTTLSIASNAILNVAGSFACTDCLGQSQIQDIYVLSSGDMMTGQLVFSGVSTDIATADGEDLTLEAGGAGRLVLADAVVLFTGGSTSFEVPASASNPTFVIQNPGSGLAHFWVEGSVGIGRSPSGTAGDLDVAEDLSVASTLAVGSAGTQTYNLIADSTASVSAAMDSDLDLYVQEDLEVDGTAYFGSIGASGTILPTTDNTYDLGSASLRWRDLYLGPTSLNISDTTDTSGAGTDYVNATLGFSGEQLQLLTTLQGSQTTGGNILIQSAYPSGSTITEAISLKSSVDLGVADELFQVGDSAADFLTILGSGNVGIGNTNPSAKLQVVGSLTTSGGAVSINDSSNYNTTINTGTSTGAVSIGSANAGAVAIQSGAALSLVGSTASYIDFPEFDVSATTGAITINDGGDAGQVSIEGTILDIDSLDFVGAGLLTSGAAQNLTFTPGTTGDLVFSTDADTVATFNGSAEGTANVTLTAGDLTLTDGDLVINAGEIAATADDTTGTSFSFTGGEYHR